MAEHEVIKHVKRSYSIVRDKEKKWWEKAKEIFFEILIIVFAITLSLWMHNRSVHNHQQDNVNNFLKGVITDLRNDSAEMNDDLAALQRRERALAYFINIYRKKPGIATDSAIYHQNRIVFGSTLLIPNVGRYEGFKSSGQLGFMNNHKLQDMITDYYEEDLKSLIWLSQILNEFLQTQFLPYLSKNLPFDQQLKNPSLETLLNKPEFVFLIVNYSANINSVIERYQGLIEKSNEIIKMANAELK